MTESIYCELDHINNVIHFLYSSEENVNRYSLLHCHKPVIRNITGFFNESINGIQYDISEATEYEYLDDLPFFEHIEWSHLKDIDSTLKTEQAMIKLLNQIRFKKTG